MSKKQCSSVQRCLNSNLGPSAHTCLISNRGSSPHKWKRKTRLFSPYILRNYGLKKTVLISKSIGWRTSCILKIYGLEGPVLFYKSMGWRAQLYFEHLDWRVQYILNIYGLKHQFLIEDLWADEPSYSLRIYGMKNWLPFWHPQVKPMCLNYSLQLESVLPGSQKNIVHSIMSNACCTHTIRSSVSPVCKYWVSISNTFGAQQSFNYYISKLDSALTTPKDIWSSADSLVRWFFVRKTFFWQGQGFN